MHTIEGGRAARPDIQALKDKLGELLRQASASRLKAHAGAAEVETGEMDCAFTPGRILASTMVFILISGDSLRLTLKVHFNIRTARNLALRIFGGESAAAISERQAIDYFKEYSNLVAGCLVTAMAKLDIDLGISLPLSTRGFYEVFADYSENRHPAVTCSDFWELRADDQSIHCSALIELLDVKRLAGLVDHEWLEEIDDDDQEVDFL